MQAAIFWIEGMPTGRLAVLPRPWGGDWLEDEIRSLRASGVTVLVSLLTRDETAELDLIQEANYCTAAGLEFLSGSSGFPVGEKAPTGGPVDQKSPKISRLLRVQLQPATVKVDGYLHVLAVAEPVGVFFTV